MLCIFMVFSLVWKHRYTVNNSRTCFNWPPNFVWIAAQLNPGLSRNENKCIAPTRLPPCQLDHSALEKNPSLNGVVYGVKTMWTPVVWDKEVTYTWHWLSLHFYGISLATQTHYEQQCAHSRTHFNCPRNVVWIAAHLTTMTTIASRPPRLPPYKLGHRLLDKNPSPNGVVCGVETIWTLVIRDHLRVWRSVYLALIIIVFLLYFLVVGVTYLKNMSML